MTNIWDQKFDRDEFVYGESPNVFIQNKLSKKPCKILALAEGEGRNAIYAAEQGHHVTAWDYSSVGLRKLQLLARTRNVEVHTELVDLSHETDWPQDKWDVVMNVFGHIGDATDRRRMFEGIHYTLKPGGMYLMEVYSDRQLLYNSGGPKDVNLLYSPQEVLDALQNWKMVHFYYGEVERYEGLWHQGLGHVIQVLAEKPS